jgi:DNA-binding CsgD family transcriptional regulator
MNSLPTTPVNPSLEAMVQWKLRRTHGNLEYEPLLVERYAGEALERLSAMNAESCARLVVITRNPCPEYLLDLLELNPGALLVGAPSSTEVAAALSKVMRGAKCQQPDVISNLLPSERAILRHLPGGTCNKRIARVLGLSHRTVRNRLVSIAEKLGLSNRTQTAMYYSGQWQWLEAYRHRDPLLSADALQETNSRRDAAN